MMLSRSGDGLCFYLCLSVHLSVTNQGSGMHSVQHLLHEYTSVCYLCTFISHLSLLKLNAVYVYRTLESARESCSTTGVTWLPLPTQMVLLGVAVRPQVSLGRLCRPVVHGWGLLVWSCRTWIDTWIPVPILSDIQLVFSMRYCVRIFYFDFSSEYLLSVLVKYKYLFIKTCPITQSVLLFIQTLPEIFLVLRLIMATSPKVNTKWIISF